MRQLITLTFFTICFLGSNLLAQDCSNGIIMNEGTILEYTSYNKKNKKEARHTHEVISVKTEGNSTISEIDFDVYVDDSQLFNSEIIFTCTDGVSSADMKSLFTQELYQMMKSMGLEIEGDQLIYPKNMKVGMTLPEGSVRAISDNPGKSLMDIEVNISDRIVEATETLTTPAGTFDCFIISYNVKNTIAVIKTTSRVKEWYSYEIGIVKSENYKKNGKYNGKSELTSIKK